MKYNYIAGILFLVSLLLICIGYVLSKNPSLFNLCPVEYVGNCLDSELKWGVGETLYLGIFPLPIVFLALIFVRREVFKAWAWFAVPFAIFAILFLASQPAITSNMFGGDRAEVTNILSLLFVFLSALIIIVKYVLLKKKHS